ncbi:MAG: winged helix-turn-helix transcriptional regulator [Burkholderiaceae bacterium]|nr:winged helix-turn-helix transcriptional regulator [Burkholderiaceae bacterium]
MTPVKTAPVAKVQGCTNLKLRQLTRQVSRHFDAEVAQAGLRITQYSLLSHVVKLGPLRPVDLARWMRMEPSTLTRNLRPLIDQGWVVLEPGADARSRLVSATDAGRAKRAEAQRHWRTAQESLNQQLGAQRVMALHALLDECGDLLAPAAEGEDDE